MTNTISKFRCWQNITNVYDLEIEGVTLFIKIKVPYLFKWLQIIDGNNQPVVSKIYITATCKIKLPKSGIGKYYLYLFVSTNGFSYEGYIGGRQIVLYRNLSGEWNFVLPQYFSWNRNLVRTNKLKFVLDHTLLPNSKTMTSKMSSLTQDCKSLREKILKIHDFVAENLYYDFDSLKDNETNRSIEQIVSSKRCVCQGYADMALVMLQSIGIESQNLLCYAIKDIYHHGWSETINRTSDLNHVITRAKLENRWLYMDITWDSNNIYEDGKYIKGASPSHRYFDVTIPFLSATHRFFKEE